MRALPPAVLPLLLALWMIVPAAAQVDLTADPARTRGAAGAPVTIVEFSDFE